MLQKKKKLKKIRRTINKLKIKGFIANHGFSRQTLIGPMGLLW